MEHEKRDKKVTPERVLMDLSEAYCRWRPLIKCMEEDFEIYAGKQWDDKDVRELELAGVKALTINKIMPMIHMISGIERQGRTDFQAFPEGAEDSIDAEIATRLVKNMNKQARADEKLSEGFEDGAIGGWGWMEVYKDYTYDLLTGELKIRKLSPFQIYPDPDAEEYDLMDARYVIKVQEGLSLDQVLELFPDKEKQIRDISAGKLNMKSWGTEAHLQLEDYPTDEEFEAWFEKQDKKEYDLITYFYKKWVPSYKIADTELGAIQDVADEAQADEYIAQAPGARKIKRNVPEIWIVQQIGRTILVDERVDTYPRWKGYPIIPFYAHRITTRIKKSELMIQGVVRALKDPQIEHNKRRTQELRHINQSINSGMGIPKGALDPKAMNTVKNWGASPGVTFEYDLEKAGGTTPEQWKIRPTQLSQGHVQLAIENAQDLKEISGINSDLLVSNENTASGRAILLRQKQGLVMLQRILDNYSRTKRILGRFFLSQLGEMFTVETAARVLGDAFIQENFSVPAHRMVEKLTQKAVQAQQGGPALSEQERRILLEYQGASDQQPAVGPDGQLATVVDPDLVGEAINKVLNDTALTKYDIAVGEGPFNETVRMSNYMLLLDLAGKGVPIPPDILIQESTLSESSKEKIIAAVSAAQSGPIGPSPQGGVA